MIQYIAIYFLTSLSCLLGIIAPSLIETSGTDAWLSMLIGIFISYIFFSLYKKRENHFKLLFLISLSCILFWNLTNFISSQYLYSTPNWFIEIILLITINCFLKHNKKTINKACLILAYVFILFYLISFFGLINTIDINNMKPILEYGFYRVIKGSIIYASYTSIPLFIFKSKHLSTKGFMISHLVIFTTIFIVIGVFGIDMANIYHYPTYHVLKRFFVGSFVERLENILSMEWIIVLLVPCSLICYHIKDFIKNKYNFNCHYILLIILYFSKFIFINDTFFEFFFINIYPFIIIFFLIKK